MTEGVLRDLRLWHAAVGGQRATGRAICMMNLPFVSSFCFYFGYILAQLLISSLGLLLKAPV